MKLLLSALLLAVSTAGFAQIQTAEASSAGVAGVEGLGAQTPREPSGMKQLDEHTQIWFGAAASQVGCPVVLTQAHLNWAASYLPVTAAEKGAERSLALGFQVVGKRPVQSVAITARLLVKKDLYQLDASAVDLQLTFSAGSGTEEAEQLRRLRLPEAMVAYSVTRVTLDQVTFENGDVWTAAANSHCALNVTGSAERIGK